MKNTFIGRKGEYLRDYVKGGKRHLDLHAEVIALLESLDCEVLECRGNIWIVPRDGFVWKLAIPQDCTGQFLPDEVREWLSARAKRLEG